MVSGDETEQKEYSPTVDFACRLVTAGSTIVLSASSLSISVIGGCIRTVQETLVFRYPLRGCVSIAMLPWANYDPAH